jgi:hypothetical protein
MPQIGKFILHSHVIPDLSAGSYTLHVTQSITAPGVTVPELDAALEVTAPRFALPPDQLLSTYPPNKSSGAYSSRLPQVVLKRRTLPWEREISGAPRETPWMILVLLTDGEAQILPPAPVAQCVSNGVSLSGRNDVDVGTAVEVTEDVIKQVFPAQDELSLLTHVRQVNLQDTELMLGDDDGWLAVVVANRLPQPGVQYRACLISIEGQLDALPTTHDIEDGFRGTHVYAGWQTAVDLYYQDQARVASGTVPVAKVSTAGTGVQTHTVQDAWSKITGVEGKTLTQGAVSLARGIRPGSLELHAIPLEAIAPFAPRKRFPLLAQWTFTCADAGDFESRMRGLDVGLVGKIMPPPLVVPGQKPPPPEKKKPEVLDTGHITLNATSRGGDASLAWYRGPLVPRNTTRTEPGADGTLSIHHVSDQARQVGPDGREDMSLAAAFEIGRLLALADSTFIAAMMLWRRAGFELARRQFLFGLEATFMAADFGLIDKGFAARVGRRLLSGLGAQDAKALGPVRPLVNPASPYDGETSDVVTAIATGLGIDHALVADLIAGRPDAGIPIASPDTTVAFDALRNTVSAELASIRGGLDQHTNDLLTAIEAGGQP